TRRRIPHDRLYQSLDEELDAPSWLALPGGEGASGGLGVGRHWHLLALTGWIATGLVYVVLLFATDEWRRLVPTTWSVFSGAVAAASSYLHLQLAEPPPGMAYNPLQQLAYFAVVFLLAPLQLATGAAMSPAVIARFPWYPRLFGTRQTARTIHFAGLCAFALFVIVHTAMVLAHGLAKELGRVTLGSDHANPTAALVIGAIGLAVIIVINVAATVFGRTNPRRAQVVLGSVVDRLQTVISHRLESRQRYESSDITPYFWTNGYPPPGPLYQTLVAHDFKDWRLRVDGMVEHPFELSLDDLRRMPRGTQITKHNCIQGWTGVAQWTGVPLADFIDRCRAAGEARYVVFHAFDDKGLTQRDAEGFYYETLDLRLARGPQALLAYEFNGRPLPIEHGAPLRLRVENQLGFKMVKWIRAITFELDYRHLGLGYGGWREDHAYYSRVVGI
ncbi:MAG TPA: molybdopterin-dependent oxidoreductase, partial [Candidatus Dormibacteraeota bacterium]|nr:molybdopterin-dependent oxidoreductase [Candidatus Dormibacteraeota bacterium]